MTRERLPNRRVSVVDCIRWPLESGRRIHVAAGFAEDGRLLETFLRGGGRVGSDTDMLLDDAAVLLSRCLQHGDRLQLIGAGVGRLPGGGPSSIVGAVVDMLLRIERGAP
jgi:hypothetical protein